MRMMTQQVSFAAGELSPRLYGRSDLLKYASGAELIENFIVRPEGGLMRRPGTRFAGATRNPLARVRLVPFVFSTLQAYMLEFGDRYIRVWKDLAPVTETALSISGVRAGRPTSLVVPGHGLSPGDRVLLAGTTGLPDVNGREFEVSATTADTVTLAGTDLLEAGAWSPGASIVRILEIPSPYGEADLQGLFTCQSADALYIAHPAHAPRTLTRSGHASWTLAAFGMDKGPFAPPNGDDRVRVMCITEGSFQPGAKVTLRASAPIFEAGHVGSRFRLSEIYLADQAVSPWSPGEGISTVAGTQVSSNGHVYALADPGAGALTGTVPPSHTEGEAWDNPIGAGNRKKWRYLHSRWSIVRLDRFVDAKTMAATIITYLCNGLAPASRALAGVEAASGRCRVAMPGHGYDDGDVVAIEGVAGSVQANGDWTIANATTDSFELVGSELPASYEGGGNVRRYPTWLWAHGAFSPARGFPGCVALHEQRLVFANTRVQPGGVWASASADFTNFLPGTEDDAAIAYNIAANQADPVQWLSSGADLLIGTLSQEFAAFGGGSGDAMTPSNIRIVGQSGEGSSPVQPVKAGVDTLFVSRSGRKLFSLAATADTGAWISTDLTELAGHMTDGTTISRLAWTRNPLSLVWLLCANGSLLAMTWRREQQVYAWTRHAMSGFVESIAALPSHDGTSDDLWLVARRTVGDSEVRHVEVMGQPFEPVHPWDKAAMSFLDSALRYQGPPAAALSGLHHLEGHTVSIVADGALHPERRVASGRVTLQAPARNVWVGLGYESRMRTLRLDLPPPSQAQGRTRRIARLTVRVHNAIGGEAGPGEGTKMETLVHRDLADPVNASPPMRSGDFDVYPASDFGQDARISIRQREPMPLDILSVMPVISVSGD